MMVASTFVSSLASWQVLSVEGYGLKGCFVDLNNIRWELRILQVWSKLLAVMYNVPDVLDELQDVLDELSCFVLVHVWNDVEFLVDH
jgi:hypothetical protein